MAKKTEKTKPTTAQGEGRDSFLPQGEPGDRPGRQREKETLDAKDENEIRLELVETGPSEMEVRLTIPPLRTCVEPLRSRLIGASAEQRASVIAEAIGRAANEAAADGIIQHATKQQEEAEAKERYEKKA